MSRRFRNPTAYVLGGLGVLLLLGVGRTVIAIEGQPATATTRSAARVKVPNGVGLDYQSAQDMWRAAGLHVAPAHDATGAHRLPVLDANWVVLSQDPQAGAEVAADSFVTATVKKYSDD
jgi:beta-lactam-binding protein with PASTA domain